MIFLSITVLTSVLIIISFKVFNILDISANQVITFNYFFGFVYGVVFREDNYSIDQVIKSDWLLPSIFIGFVFILGFFLFSKSAIKAGVSITAVSAKMSVIIPVMAGFVLFGDSISTMKVVGIALAMLSFYFIFKKGVKERINYKYIILPLSLLLVSGLNDSLVKFMEHNYLTDNILLFLTFVFLSAFIFGIIFGLSNSKSRQNFVSYKGILGGFLLGTFNFWNAWAFIKSMNIFESSMLFPTVNVSVVSISAFVGLLFFKEKLKLINWIGIFMAVIAILLISLENGN